MKYYHSLNPSVPAFAEISITISYTLVNSEENTFVALLSSRSLIVHCTTLRLIADSCHGLSSVVAFIACGLVVILRCVRHYVCCFVLAKPYNVVIHRIEL